jgi:PPOX class probable F420-dependent enzyme
MELTTALEFVAARNQGVLATVGDQGLPHLTNILYSVADDGIEISITDGRVKTRNLRRQPRGALHVVGDNFWQYAVIEARAELSAVAGGTQDGTVEQLVAMYRRVRGEHPDWDEYRRDMVQQRRILLTLRPERAYGILRS